MSNALAIATVTAALHDVVRQAAQSTVAGADVVVGRPQAAGSSPPHRVYLYLYQVMPNAAWRNDDLPTRSGGTRIRRSQAALTLNYLLVFQGADADLEPELMLGAVVRDLHAQPILTPQQIEQAITGRTALTGSDLAHSIERVRLSPLGLSLEELSKLWSVFFQTPHAVSVAYEASVVLLESEESPRPPLPVLSRGVTDRGVTLVVGPFPDISRVTVGEAADATAGVRPPPYPSAALGRTIFVQGSHLAGSALTLRFFHRKLNLTNTVVVDPADVAEREARVTLPDTNAAATAWAPGIMELTAVVAGTPGQDPRTSNTVAVPLAPAITSIAPASPVARAANGSATLTVTCTPHVRPTQRASLLLAGTETVAEPFPNQTGTLTFVVADAPLVQNAVVRLRIDGADSMPFRRIAGLPEFEFDPAQQVTIV
jgi:hypothetical protein